MVVTISQKCDETTAGEIIGLFFMILLTIYCTEYGTTVSLSIAKCDDTKAGRRGVLQHSLVRRPPAPMIIPQSCSAHVRASVPTKHENPSSLSLHGTEKHGNSKNRKRLLQQQHKNKKADTMNKTKIHPDTQLDVSDKRPAEKFQLMHEPIPTTEAKMGQKIRRGHDGSKPFCRGATKFPCTDASKAATAGLMQSTLVQPAALQCAIKKKEGRLPWEKLFRFGRMDSALLAVFAPEDLNALHRELNGKDEVATNPKAKAARTGRRSKS